MLRHKPVDGIFLFSSIFVIVFPGGEYICEASSVSRDALSVRNVITHCLLQFKHSNYSTKNVMLQFLSAAYRMITQHLAFQSVYRQYILIYTIYFCSINCCSIKKLM